jgi:AraC family transcriptional regulator of adaptative response/methylated-DNA-[protein]-cysteine methyltransferase
MHDLPTTARMHKALLDRDPAFEGVFVVGVKTTGIFCRPTCPARKPRIDNCEFFATPQDALYAGYRACLRCRPLGRTLPPVVEQLIAIVEQDPTRRITESDLADLGIDPSTARRQFRKHCAMTFHAYQRARRMGLALADLRRHDDIPRAMHTGAYVSHSGFSAAFTSIFGKPPSAARGVATLIADRVETPLGPMVAVANDDAVCLLEFHDRRALERELTWLRRHHNAEIIPGTNAHLRHLARELEEYFAHARTTFTTAVAIEGTDFQCAVWHQLRAIPPGQTRSYRDIAIAIGRPDSHRAVARANGDNRIAILIPCHRVIRADGSISGYAGGVWRKRRLLDLEAAPVDSTRRLSLAI